MRYIIILSSVFIRQVEWTEGSVQARESDAPIHSFCIVSDRDDEAFICDKDFFLIFGITWTALTY